MDLHTFLTNQVIVKIYMQNKIYYNGTLRIAWIIQGIPKNQSSDYRHFTVVELLGRS